MLAEAQSELILGHWWQLAAATAFMAVFVTAFSLMTDALRDALDPKLRGLRMSAPLLRDPRPARRLPHGHASTACVQRVEAVEGRRASTCPRTPRSRWSANRARARA